MARGARVAARAGSIPTPRPPNSSRRAAERGGRAGETEGGRRTGEAEGGGRTRPRLAGGRGRRPRCTRPRAGVPGGRRR